MANSWKYGPSSTAMGVGQGIVSGAENFAKNFFHGQEVKDALAQKAAELTAQQRHQQRLEDLQAQSITSADKRAGDEIDQRYILAGDRASVEARHPESPETIAMRNEVDATIDRRKQAGSEAITGMSEANAFNRIGQTPLNKPAMDENAYAAQFKGDPILGFEDTSPTDLSAPPVRFSGVNPKTGGEMQPVAPVARPSLSELGERLGAAAAGVRERKNIDDEFKAQTEITKAEMQKIYDLEKQGMINDAQWEQVVQRGKDQIRASATSGTGRQKMEQDFILKMAKEYRMRHPEFKTDAEAASHLEQLKKYEPVGASPAGMEMKLDMETAKTALDMIEKGASEQDKQAAMRVYLPNLPAGTTSAQGIEMLRSVTSKYSGGGGGGGGAVEPTADQVAEATAAWGKRPEVQSQFKSPYDWAKAAVNKRQ